MADAADADRQALFELLKRGGQADGHGVIARELAGHGVTHVYGISGTPVDETLVACSRAGIRIIATRHQQAAVLAAGAHNYLAGALRATVVVSSGPGVSNCTTGISVARDNGWPLMVIGGRRTPALDDRGGFQALDGSRLFESITGQHTTVTHTDELGAALRIMVRYTCEGRPGPVYVDVTEGALAGRERLPPAPLASSPVLVPSIDWSAVTGILLGARRPLLVIGEALRFGECVEALRSLVELLHMPFLTTPMARGFLPEEHPLCATTVRAGMAEQADVVLLLGASLDWVFRFGAEFAANARYVRCGFEPDKVVRERRDALDFCGNPALFTAALAAALQREMIDQSLPVLVDADWIDSLKSLRLTQNRRRMTVLEDAALPMTPAFWMALAAKAVPAGCRTILDGNISMAWAERYFPADFPLTRLTAGANGCMGVGIPFAIASCLADPEVPVVVICGDFALGVGLQDLETAVRYRLPMVILLACNGGHGARLRKDTYWTADTSDLVVRFLPDIRYDQIMSAFGGQGVRAQTPEQLTSALRQAFATRQTTLIQIDTRDDVSLPHF